MEIIRTVMVKLTEEEIMTRADELVAVIAKHQSIENEMKDVTKGFRKKLKEADRERDRIAKAIEERAEERNIACTARPDYRGGIMEYVNDKGDVVDSRELEFSERQMAVPGSGTAPEGADDQIPISGPPPDEDAAVAVAGAENVVAGDFTAKKKRGRPRKNTDA